MKFSEVMKHGEAQKEIERIQERLDKKLQAVIDALEDFQECCQANQTFVCENNSAVSYLMDRIIDLRVEVN